MAKQFEEQLTKLGYSLTEDPSDRICNHPDREFTIYFHSCQYCIDVDFTKPLDEITYRDLPWYKVTTCEDCFNRTNSRCGHFNNIRVFHNGEGKSVV